MDLRRWLQIIHELQEAYKLKIYVELVPTEKNKADALTRVKKSWLVQVKYVSYFVIPLKDRIKSCHEAHYADVVIGVILVGNAEPFALMVIAHKGFDQPYAREIFLQDRIERRKFFLYLREQRLAENTEDHEQHERHRQDRHRRPRERGVGAEQNNDRAREQNDRANKLQ